MYQWLNAWRACVTALRDRDRLVDAPVVAVGVEVDGAGNLDDVVLYRPAARSSYWQVKYAVDATSLVNTAYMVKPSRSGGPSILAKVAAAWQRLTRDGSRPDLALVTNRALDPQDPLTSGCDARTSLLMPAAGRGSASSKRGRARSRWADAAALTEGELMALLTVLRFDVGLSPQRLREALTAQMNVVGLPDGDEDIEAGANWIARQVRDGHRRLELVDIDRAVTTLWPHRIRSGYANLPRATVRVRDAKPRSLGVHAAIEVAGAVGELPCYVLRDIDECLRAVVGPGEGFVLLVGSSSVGKTRSAYEALRAEVPDWWLFHPRDVAHLKTFVDAPVSHTVVWLDEIQRYLDDGLSASTIRALLDVREPVLVIATLWPEAYQAFRTPPPPGAQGDPFGRQRELLNLAKVLFVGAKLSAVEQERAAGSAALDPRLEETLASDYGMIQALAAAPELVHRWEGAPDRQTWALVAAAADARRVGIEPPMSAELLGAAVPGYLTAVEKAKAPDDWFEKALGYATTELHGAAAILAPVAIDMGVPAGYAIADYVYQHSLRTRRTAVPPDSAWNAYAEHLTDGSDLLAAAQAAEHRKLYHHAGRLYHAADSDALPALALLYLKTGQRDKAEATWRAALATTGAETCWNWLASSLARRDRREEAEQVYRDAIAAGVYDAHSRFGHQLLEWGRFDEAERTLRAGLAESDPEAWFGLAEVLREQGRLREAEQVLRDAIATRRFDVPHNEGGGPSHWLIKMLRDQGRWDEAETAARESAAVGAPDSGYDLASLLQDRGKLEEAELAWRDAVAADENGARHQLSWLLLNEDRIDEALDLWREAIHAGHPRGHSGMADVLKELGRIEEAERAMRDAIATDEVGAREALAELLEENGRISEAERLWREAIAAGEDSVLNGLTSLLKELGRAEEARDIERYGLNADGSTRTRRS